MSPRLRVFGSAPATAARPCRFNIRHLHQSFGPSDFASDPLLPPTGSRHLQIPWDRRGWSCFSGTRRVIWRGEASTSWSRRLHRPARDVHCTSAPTRAARFAAVLLLAKVWLPSQAAPLVERAAANAEAVAAGQWAEGYDLCHTICTLCQLVRVRKPTACDGHARITRDSSVIRS